MKYPRNIFCQQRLKALKCDLYFSSQQQQQQQPEGLHVAFGQRVIKEYNRDILRVSQKHSEKQPSVTTPDYISSASVSLLGS